MIYQLMKCLVTIIKWADMLLATALLYILGFLPKQFLKSWYPYLFRKWCWIFIRALGVSLKFHQKNKNALSKQYIVIANHPSAFEDIGMNALFKARFLAKEEIKSWWIFGRISIAAGTFYVKRDSKESRKLASEKLVNILSQGDNVGLYPEGGCKGRRIHLPFQYGAFDAAIKTGIPILPVFLHYEAQEAFEWQANESLLQTLWKIYKCPNKTVNYYIFDTIDPKDFKDKETFCTYVQNLYLQWQNKYLE